MVFDRVVCSALEEHGNFSPFVTLLPMGEEEDPLFFTAPDTLFNSGVEVVVPALTALFSDATRQIFSDLGPFLWAFLLHED